jgi:hypothetical protein
MFVKDYRLKKEYYDLEVQRRSGYVLKIDHSFKVANHIMQRNGEKLFEGLHTMVNENEEIRSQHFVQSTSHAQLEQQLKAFYETQVANNAELPALVYTDRCCTDRPFLKKIWPSLTKETKDFEMLTLPSDWVVHYCHDLGAIKIRVEEIVRYIERLEGDDMIPVGFDIEWNWRRTDNKVGLIQIALPSKIIYLFQISCAEWSTLRPHLDAILTSQRLLKVGRNIQGDVTRFMKGHETVITPTQDINEICYEKNIISEKNVSLKALCRRLMKKDMEKDKNVAKSNWDTKLSAIQKTYAALDAYVSLEVYRLSLEAPTVAFRSPLEWEDEVESSPTDELTSPTVYEDTRVKQDVFHLHQRIEVPRQHPHQWTFFTKLRDAMMIFHQEDLAKVTSVVEKEFGCSFDDYLAQNPDWVFKRVRRFIPPPKELRERIERVVNEFKRPEYIDPATRKPLLSKDALAQIDNILKHVDHGCVSDPKNVKLYYDTGKFDKYKLRIYRCVRGTNSVEGGVHQKLSLKLRMWNAGPEVTQASTGVYRQRHNIRASQRNRAKFPNIGHYDHYLLDDIQAAAAQIGRRYIFPWWSQTRFYRNSGETFGIVPCLPKEEQVDVTDADVVEYTPSIAYLAKQMKSLVPHLPVNTMEEKMLFAVNVGGFMAGSLASIDFERMAENWNSGKLMKSDGTLVVPDGKKIFTKLKEHLQSYLKTYVRALTRRQLIRCRLPTIQSLSEDLRHATVDVHLLESVTPKALSPSDEISYAIRQEEAVDDILWEVMRGVQSSVQHPVATSTVIPAPQLGTVAPQTPQYQLPQTVNTEGLIRGLVSLFQGGHHANGFAPIAAPLVGNRLLPRPAMNQLPLSVPDNANIVPKRKQGPRKCQFCSDPNCRGGVRRKYCVVFHANRNETTEQCEQPGHQQADG